MHSYFRLSKIRDFNVNFYLKRMSTNQLVSKSWLLKKKVKLTLPN